MYFGLLVNSPKFLRKKIFYTCNGYLIKCQYLIYFIEWEVTSVN